MEFVLTGSLRISNVCVDAVDVLLVVLDALSLAVDPESRGICPCPAPKDLARVEMACADSLLCVKLDNIREKSRRWRDSHDEIEDPSA